MDKDECRQSDWYGIGVEDGARGRPVERLGDHRRACAKHNVTPDTERYIAGRNRRSRATEIERLEALTRESEQLESRIQQFR